MAKITIEVFQCEICKGAILGAMVGFGDGLGDKFVHLHCWEAFQQGFAPDPPSAPKNFIAGIRNDDGTISFPA